MSQDEFARFALQTLFQQPDETGWLLETGLFVYVVQKHRATALHYDFRLEIGGVMSSWSVPKGPSLDPGVRRLAMPTGSHDLEYRKFEGNIPKGIYGAGTVMIWDEGTYTPEVEVGRGARRAVADRQEAEGVVEAGLRDGNLKFTLYGKKLQGSFALVRTAGFGGKESWLLIKHRDEYSRPGYDANDYDFSAVSKKTLAQIAGQDELPGPSGRPESEEKERVADHRRGADGHRSGR